MDKIQAATRLHCFLIIDRFPGKICDVSYSTFPEDYTSSDDQKKSMKSVYKWLLKWKYFSLTGYTFFTCS